MAEILIRRAHHSTPAGAKKMAEKIAAKLDSDYQLKSSWAGDVLNFARSGVNGSLAVTANELKIDVKLGFLMAAFKSPIQDAIEKNLDALIKAPTEPAAKAADKPTTKAAEAAKAPAKKPPTQSNNSA